MFLKKKKNVGTFVSFSGQRLKWQKWKNPENDLTLVILAALHEIDRLLEILDDDTQNEINTIQFFFITYDTLINLIIYVHYKL